MSTLLLNLRGVPDDEADEVRALLEESHIAYYETPPNRWMISAGGIWIEDDTQAPRAKRLFNEYQELRRVRMRAAYEQALLEGRAETFMNVLRRYPVRVMIVLAVAAMVLYISVVPYLSIK